MAFHKLATGHYEQIKEFEENLNYILEFEKFADSSKPKDFRIELNRLDVFSEIRDQTSYTGGNIKVVGEPNPPPDWRKKLRAKYEAIRRTDKSADLSTHKIITRLNKGRIEVLMPAPTRGVGRSTPCKNKTLKITERTEVKSRSDESFCAQKPRLS